MRFTNGTCTAVRRDGSPCNVPALRQGAFCFHHDPDRAAERARARKRGGQRANAKRWAVIQGGLDPLVNRPRPDVSKALAEPDQPGLTIKALGELLGHQIDKLTARPELTPRELDALARLAVVYMRAQDRAKPEGKQRTLEELEREIKVLTALERKLD